MRMALRVCRCALRAVHSATVEGPVPRSAFHAVCVAAPTLSHLCSASFARALSRGASRRQKCQRQGLTPAGRPRLAATGGRADTMSFVSLGSIRPWGGSLRMGRCSSYNLQEVSGARPCPIRGAAAIGVSRLRQIIHRCGKVCGKVIHNRRGRRGRLSDGLLAPLMNNFGNGISRSFGTRITSHALPEPGIIWGAIPARWAGLSSFAPLARRRRWAKNEIVPGIPLLTPAGVPIRRRGGGRRCGGRGGGLRRWPRDGRRSSYW
jgi:hypothetical protein